MNSYSDAFQTKIQALRSSSLARIKEVEGVLSSHFGKTISEVSAHSRTAVQANEQVTAGFGVTRDVLIQTIDDMELLTRWLKLKIPKIADGGNFGAAVVQEVVKAIEAKISSLNKALDDLPAYFSERAAAVEKVVVRGSTDEKVTKTKSNTTGGKDGDEEKATETRLEEKTTKTGQPLFDQVEHVVALDAKFFLIFKRDVDDCLSTYLTAFDILEKNYSLLNAPRGDKDDSSHLSMF